MLASDFVSIAALIVSLVSIALARFSAREAMRMNELTFRKEWLEAFETICKAKQELTVPSGPFAKLTAIGKRGFPDPLSETVLNDLTKISWRASLWANQNVHKCLTDAVMWNQQLEFNSEQRSLSDIDLPLALLEQLDREARNYSDEARKSLGIAIDIVRDRLRASAP